MPFDGFFGLGSNILLGSWYLLLEFMWASCSYFILLYTKASIELFLIYIFWFSGFSFVMDLGERNWKAVPLNDALPEGDPITEFG